VNAGKLQASRGTFDVLPEQAALRLVVEEAARGTLESAGYRRIETPIFEDTEVFRRTVGESTDIVQKEMYTFQDAGGRSLTLRPEVTAPIVRSYLEHGMHKLPQPVKLWYLGPCFRHERAQAGRYRQFWQIGAEILGTQAPAADVEMIALFVDLFEAWDFRDLTVMINSLGTPDTRRAYGEALKAWLAPAIALLSADSQRRLEENPLRVLDSKDPRDIAILRNGGAEGWDEPEREAVARALATLHATPMPRMLDVLDAESRAHWHAVTAGLDALGIAWEIDHGLVRGLDYYTRTTFEVHDRSLGAAQSALGGGGRYDGLIEALGGPPTPGVGFSIGLDRVVLVLEQRGAEPPARALDAFVVSMESTRTAALALVRELRRRFAVDFDLEGRGFGAQMKAAGKSGARRMVLVGEDEWSRGEVVVKDLGTGEQKNVARDAIEAALAAPAGEPSESRR
jgi:histidyl-tRNA synthetase